MLNLLCRCNSYPKFPLQSGRPLYLGCWYPRILPPLLELRHQQFEHDLLFCLKFFTVGLCIDVFPYEQFYGWRRLLFLPSPELFEEPTSPHKPCVRAHLQLFLHICFALLFAVRCLCEHFAALSLPLICALRIGWKFFHLQILRAVASSLVWNLSKKKKKTYNIVNRNFGE